MIDSLPGDVPSVLRSIRAANDGERDLPALTVYRGRAKVGGFSRGELAREVGALGERLGKEHGVRKGDRVAVLSPNRLELPVVLLAVMSLGAVVVPLSPTASAEEWKAILDHSGARCLISALPALPANRPGAARDEPHDLGAGLERLLAMDALGIGRAPDRASNGREALAAHAAEAASLGDQPAILLYTSGTTGEPKGVLLTHGNIVSNAAAMVRRFGLDHTTQLAVLPLHHAHAFGFGLMTSLLSAGHLVLAEAFDPIAFGAMVAEERVAIASVVPSLVPLLVKARLHQKRVPTLKQILVSSAPLRVEVGRELEERTGIRLAHGWGLSEYTNFACALPYGDAPSRSELLFGGEMPSVGTPLEGTEVAVRDAEGHELHAGQRGELWVRGPGRMVGYYRDEAATAACFDGPWLRTGDEGFFVEQGGERFFFISGRLKEVINRSGEKLSPAAIERHLLAFAPKLEGRVAVVGFPHREHGEEVGLYVQRQTGKEGEPLPAAELNPVMEALGQMPPALRPRAVVVGGTSIPRTATGKIQRRLLESQFSSLYDVRPPKG